MNSIYEEIAAERKRQNEKWGEMNLPMVKEPVDLEFADSEVYHYKKENKVNKSWMSILLEKVYGTFAETDLIKQREKLIQAAAVIVVNVEYLDRQIEGGKECIK